MRLPRSFYFRLFDLGPSVDAETRAAWAAAYRYLSATMQVTAGDSGRGGQFRLERGF